MTTKNISYDQLSTFSNDLLWEIMLASYKKGMVEHTIGVAELLRPDKSTYNFKRTELTNLMVEKNDQDALEKLTGILLKAGANLTTEKVSIGGVAKAVLTRNMEMLKMLAERGAEADSLSLSDIQKINPEIHSPQGIYNESYQGQSVFFIAVASNDVAMLNFLKEHWGQNCKLLKTERENVKGTRGGYTGRSVEKMRENLLLTATSHGASEALNWLITNFEEDASKYCVDSINWYIDQFAVLPEAFREKVWSKLIEKETKPYTYGTPKSLLDIFLIKEGNWDKLITKIPEKALQIWETSVIPKTENFLKPVFAHGSELLVKRCLSGLTEKELALCSWLDHPGETKHTKRHIGPIITALLYNKHAETFLSLFQNDALKNKEVEMLKEYVSRGWIKRWGNENYNNNTARSSEKELENDAKERQRIRTAFEKARLMTQVQQTTERVVKKGMTL